MTEELEEMKNSILHPNNYFVRKFSKEVRQLVPKLAAFFCYSESLEVAGILEMWSGCEFAGVKVLSFAASPFASWWLGMYYSDKHSTNYDLNAALKYFGFGASLGDSRSKYKLISLYENGDCKCFDTFSAQEKKEFEEKCQKVFNVSDISEFTNNLLSSPYVPLKTDELDELKREVQAEDPEGVILARLNSEDYKVSCFHDGLKLTSITPLKESLSLLKDTQPFNLSAKEEKLAKLVVKAIYGDDKSLKQLY